MRALFWKEWRGNAKWALLAAICVAAAMFYGLRSDPRGMGYNDNLWQGLLSPQILMVSSFGFPLIGLVLGFLQILTELRRDQWAFLVHRPITRSKIFWGKALPGLLLYAIATMVPYFAVAWWISLPGSLAAPFDWRMTQAGLMDSLTGAGFYFAALWTGISQGKWYGRRLLPFLAACYAAVSSKGYQSFDGALQITAVTLLALIPATWAAFQTFGIFKREKWIGKVCTVLAMLLAVAMVQSWLLAGWHLIVPRKPYISTGYRTTQNGELVRTSQEGSWFKKVTSLDGLELKPSEGREVFTWEDFLPASLVVLNFPTSEEPNSQPYRLVQHYLDKLWTSQSGGPAWYFLHRNSLFVTYDRQSKLLAGYLGPHGFAGPGEAEKAGQFSFYNSQRHSQNIDGVFNAREAIYDVKPNRKEVREIYRPPVGEILLDGTVYRDGVMDVETPTDFISATNKALQFHNADGTLIWSFPHLENLKHFNYVFVSRLADHSRYFLLYQPDYKWSKKHGPVYFELTADGAVSNRIDLPNEPSSPFSWSDWGLKNAISPFGQTIWEQVLYATRCVVGPEKYTPIWATPAKYRNITLAAWGISLLTGLVCAALCLPLIRRIAGSSRERNAWLLFLLFYGLAGVIVFLVVNNWPRRIPCPACGKKRSIESSICEGCGTKWPEPKPDGTEIFEFETRVG